MIAYIAVAVLFGTPLFLIYTRPERIGGGRNAWTRPTLIGAALLGLAATVGWTRAETASDYVLQRVRE